jgi:hypothetical protein
MNGIIRLKLENSAGSSKHAPEEGLTIFEMLAIPGMQSLNDGLEDCDIGTNSGCQVKNGWC